MKFRFAVNQFGGVEIGKDSPEINFGFDQRRGFTDINFIGVIDKDEFFSMVTQKLTINESNLFIIEGQEPCLVVRGEINIKIGG